MKRQRKLELVLERTLQPSLFPDQYSRKTALRSALMSLLNYLNREADAVPCCVDGWVPGEFGIERCDNCARFENDTEAQQHVARVITTLSINGELDRRAPCNEQ